MDGIFELFFGEKIKGEFEIRDDDVVRAEGYAKEFLKLGPVKGMNHYRIQHSMNNGYWHVKKVSI